MSEDKLIILIFFEVSFILAIALVILAVHATRLKKTLAQISVITANEKPSNDENENAWPPEKFLSEELKATNAAYFALAGRVIPENPDAFLTDTSNEKSLIMLLRYYYLQAELNVLKLRESHDVFWSTLSPLLLKLIPLLPSSYSAQEELSKQKNQLETLKKHSHELELSQKTLFMIQNLLRSKLPNAYIQHFLPLAEEIELLTKEQGFNTIKENYTRLFDQLQSALSSTQTTSDDKENTGNTQAPSDEIGRNYQELSHKLVEFLDLIRDKKVLSDAPLNELHNTIIKLNYVFKTQEKALADIRSNFNEAQMCNTFLESELAASQETIRSLMETIEENNKKDNASSKNEAGQT